MLMRINQFPILSPSWQSVLDLEKDLESVFGAIPSQAFASRASRLPLMNLAERENESVLTVELPGVNKEDVKISLEGELITVTGERKAQNSRRRAVVARGEQQW